MSTQEFTFSSDNLLNHSICDASGCIIYDIVTPNAGTSTTIYRILPDGSEIPIAFLERSKTTAHTVSIHDGPLVPFDKFLHGKGRRNSLRDMKTPLGHFVWTFGRKPELFEPLGYRLVQYHRERARLFSNKLPTKASIEVDESAIPILDHVIVGFVVLGCMNGRNRNGAVEKLSRVVSKGI